MERRRCSRAHLAKKKKKDQKFSPYASGAGAAAGVGGDEGDRRADRVAIAEKRSPPRMIFLFVFGIIFDDYERVDCCIHATRHFMRRN